MLKNLKIEARLLVICATVILFGVGISVWSVFTITRTADLGRQMVALDAEASAVLDASNSLVRMAVADLSYVLIVDQQNFDEHLVQRAKVNRYISRMRLTSTDEQIHQYLDEIEAGLEVVDANWLAMEDALLDEDYESADTLAEENAAILYGLAGTADTIYALIEEDLESVKTMGDIVYFGSLGLALAALLLFIAVVILAPRTITRQVTRPIVTLIDAAGAVEQGTFDASMLDTLTGRTDEIGRVARSMLQTARDVEERRAALTAEAADLRARLAG